jgi:hypothetical protein
MNHSLSRAVIQAWRFSVALNMIVFYAWDALFRAFLHP